MNFIYGINAVSEALKSQGRAFQWVGVAKEQNGVCFMAALRGSAKDLAPYISKKKE